VKPLTQDILARADEALSDAKRILEIGIVGQAARLAYQTQFHAARALIFERTGKMAKTHKGVRTLYHQISQEDPILRKGASGLTSAYQFKESVDYETGLAAIVSAEDADETILFAEDFLRQIRQTLQLHTP
jgi:uncharacterized protein (UPF0332 family)